MTWEFRFVNLASQNGGEDWFELREVYYNDDGSLMGHSNPCLGSETAEGVALLISNTEVFVSMEPSARGVSGHWNDVVLYRDDVQTIETYLRCFAPWVFEERED